MRFLALTDLHGELPAIDLNDHSYDAILLNGDYGFDGTQRYAVKEKDGDAKEDVIDEAIGQADQMLAELESRDEPVYMVPGNWDLQSYEIYHEHREMTDIDRDSTEIDDVHIAGYGAFETPTRPELPLYQEFMDEYPDREERETAFFDHKDDLEQAYDPQSETDILLAHNSPQGAELDTVQTDDGPRHIGSIVLRDVVDKHQPDYVVSGHVHESSGTEELGETTVINPGYRGAVIIDTEQDTIDWVTSSPDTDTPL